MLICCVEKHLNEDKENANSFTASTKPTKSKHQNFINVTFDIVIAKPTFDTNKKEPFTLSLLNGANFSGSLLSGTLFSGIYGRA